MMKNNIIFNCSNLKKATQLSEFIKVQFPTICTEIFQGAEARKYLWFDGRVVCRALSISVEQESKIKNFGLENEIF